MELFNLKGRVALFTGGNRGLGKAMVLALAKAGADIALVGRSAEPEVIAEIKQLGVRAEFYPFDLANIEGISALV